MCVQRGIVSNMRKMIICKDTVILWLIGIFLLYMFWFQYAVKPITGFLSIIGFVLLFVSINAQRVVNDYRYLFNVAFFVIALLVSGVFFSKDKDLFFNLFFEILKCLLPMIAIYNYVGTDKERLKNIFFLILVSIVLMSISLFSKGIDAVNGAIILGDLNSNKFSCYVLIGVVAVLYLLNEYDSRLMKLALVISLIIMAVAQIEAASRRGVIVFAFMIITYIHSIIFVKYKAKPVYKITSALIALILLYVIYLCFSEKFTDTVVFHRLLLRNSAADQKRAYYQREAWDIFLSNPLFGEGLGSVMRRVGMYSHSLYYELLASGGIIATFCLLFPMGTKIVQYWKASKVSTDIKLMVQARTMAWFIVGVLISGIAVVYFYDIDFYIIVGIFAAYSNCLNSLGYDEPIKVVVGSCY